MADEQDDPPAIPLEMFGVPGLPGVVALLEMLLDEAKQGELRGFAISCAYRGEHDGAAFVLGDSSIATLVLGLERCKKNLLEFGEEPDDYFEFDDEDEDEED